MWCSDSLCCSAGMFPASPSTVFVLCFPEFFSVLAMRPLLPRSLGTLHFSRFFGDRKLVAIFESLDLVLLSARQYAWSLLGRIRVAVLCSLAVPKLSQPKYVCSLAEMFSQGPWECIQQFSQKLCVVLWLHEFHNLFEVCCFYSYGESHACRHHTKSTFCEPCRFLQGSSEKSRGGGTERKWVSSSSVV